MPKDLRPSTKNCYVHGGLLFEPQDSLVNNQNINRYYCKSYTDSLFINGCYVEEDVFHKSSSLVRRILSDSTYYNYRFMYDGNMYCISSINYTIILTSPIILNGDVILLSTIPQTFIDLKRRNISINRLSIKKNFLKKHILVIGTD